MAPCSELFPRFAQSVPGWKWGGGAKGVNIDFKQHGIYKNTIIFRCMLLLFDRNVAGNNVYSMKMLNNNI
jgi:hypothetical protein